MTDPSAIHVNAFQGEHREPFQAPSSPNSGRRITILIPSLGGGGAERVALLIASGLLDRGHEVDVLLRDLVCDYPREVPAGVRLFFLSHSGGTEDRSDLEQLPITPRPLIQPPLPIHLRFPRLALGAALNRDQLTLLASNRLPRWAAAIAAYLDRERPDAVLATLTPAVAAATMAVRLAHHPVRTVAQAAGVLRSRRDILRARMSYPHADASVGVSQGISNELAKFPGMSCDRVHTVYNPVLSADLLRNAREPAGHLWLDEPGPPAVLAIGRLHKVKDFPILLAAFARFLARRPARLIVLGKGPQLSDLLALAHELRISEHVDFPGFVKNPYAFLARARLFVLSSRSEGLANVLIEAMACGCPVVSTDCPFGPKEILEGGRWGELVPVGDPKALAEAMVRTIEAPPRQNALRERAGFFSVERAVSRYEELLLR